jgi:uncharacterized membrane protein
MTETSDLPAEAPDQWAQAEQVAEATVDALNGDGSADPQEKAREIQQVARDLVREKVPVHEVVEKALHEHPRRFTRDGDRSFGERAADEITRWLGSWTFIIVQSVILAIWISLNLTELIFRAWDPYPFILLNLALSFQAAYAAPIIMMSQNRQAAIEAKIAHNAYDQVAEIDNMQKVQMEILEAIHELQKQMAKQNQGDQEQAAAAPASPSTSDGAH